MIFYFFLSVIRKKKDNKKERLPSDYNIASLVVVGVFLLRYFTSNKTSKAKFESGSATSEAMLHQNPGL